MPVTLPLGDSHNPRPEAFPCKCHCILSTCQHCFKSTSRNHPYLLNDTTQKHKNLRPMVTTHSRATSHFHNFCQAAISAGQPKESQPTRPAQTSTRWHKAERNQTTNLYKDKATEGDCWVGPTKHTSGWIKRQWGLNHKYGPVLQLISLLAIQLGCPDSAREPSATACRKHPSSYWLVCWSPARVRLI